MRRKKTKHKGQYPEQTRKAAPIVMHSENETPAGHGGEQPTPPQKRKRIWNWLEKLGEPLTIVTILLFLATVALVIATRDLVHDAQDTAKRQLRAYLILDQADITRFTAGRTIEFNGVIKNTGQTPAYDIDGYSAIMYDRFPLPYKFPIVSTVGLRESWAMIGRDQTVHTRIPTTPVVTAETIAEIVAGKMAVYVWGRATYRDAFGLSRYTNFRLYYTKPNETAGLLGHLDKEGNEAN